MRENVSAAGPSATATTTDAYAGPAPSMEAGTTTEAAPTTETAPIPASALTTGANLISLAQTGVGQIAPVIQAITGTTGTQESAAT